MPISIQPATMAAVSYVAANMRPEDRAEIWCQLHPDTPPEAVAQISLSSGQAWVCWLNGQPVAAFGWGSLNYRAASLWAFGSPPMRRALPEITKFVVNMLARRFAESHLSYLEARSLVDHHEAHEWLQALGGLPVATLENYGGEEDFILFTWTRKDWENGRIPAQLLRLGKWLTDETADWLQSKVNEDVLFRRRLKTRAAATHPKER